MLFPPLLKSPVRLAALLVILGLFTAASAPAYSQDWPTYQHDVHHTGRAPVSFDPNALRFSWKAPTGYATPLIVGDTVIAMKNQQGVGSDVTHVTAFRLSDGAVKWDYQGKYSSPSQPTYSDGMVIYATTEPPNYTSKVFVLDAATGALKYTVPIGDLFLGTMPTIHRNTSTGDLIAYIATHATIYAIKLNDTSGSILWTRDGSFGGASIPTIVGNSVVLAGPRQYYAFDQTTGAVNHFHNGSGSGGGGTTVAYDKTRSQFYVLLSYSSTAFDVLTAYKYVNNGTITRLWQRSGPGIRGGGSVAIGPEGKIYCVDNTTLLEIDPDTGNTLRSLPGQSFANGVTPMLSDGCLWAFSEQETLVYDLDDLTLIRRFKGSRGSVSSAYNSPGALGHSHFLLDYGTTYDRPGFDVYATGASWTATALSVGADNKTRLLWSQENKSILLTTLSATGRYEGQVLYGPFPGWTATALATGNDNKTRLLWSHSTGAVRLWTLTAEAGLKSSQEYGPFAGWTAASISVGSDNKTRLLWKHSSGMISLWVLSATGVGEGHVQYGPFLDWQAATLATGSDNNTRLLWKHSGEAISLWTLPSTGAGGSYVQHGPFADWTATALSMGSDNKTRLLWNHASAAISVWTLSSTGAGEGYVQYGPFDGWTATALATGADHRTRLLWNHNSGMISLWSLSPTGMGEGYTLYGPL